MSKPQLQVLFAPDAERDVIERADYLAQEGTLDLSNRFVEAVAHTVNLLTHMPNIGKVFRTRSKRQNDLRIIVVSGVFDRSVIFYKATNTELRIERVLHSAQNLSIFFR